MSHYNQEVYNKISLVLIDALGVDEDEINPEATLVGDLGAESIDFLDIVYNLEKTFDVPIPRGELIPDDILTSAEFVQEGKVTPDGILQLKQRMPFADLSTFKDNPVVQNFGNLLTVKDMCCFIEGKLQKAA